MSHGRVRRLFSSAISSWSAGRVKPIPLSFDNVIGKFDGVNEDHIEVHLIPADTFTETLGGDQKAFIGLFQMKIVMKYGTGALDTENIVEELQNVFKVDQIFKDETGFSVQVTTPIVVPEGKQIGGQWAVPCYFSYRADTN